MSKARRIETVMPPCGDKRDVELILSIREAEVLSAIMCRIGGDPKGARGCADSIYRALMDVKVHEADDRCDGAIGFK